jgi:hypothetical protein
LGIDPSRKDRFYPVINPTNPADHHVIHTEARPES